MHLPLYVQDNMIHVVLLKVLVGADLLFFSFYLSVLVLYHTNWEIADSSNTEYGFYLGLFIQLHVQIMFFIKPEQTGSKSVSH